MHLKENFGTDQSVNNFTSKVHKISDFLITDMIRH